MTDKGVKHKNLNESLKLFSSLKTMVEIIIKFKSDSLANSISSIESFEKILTDQSSLTADNLDSIDNIYTILYPIFHKLKHSILDDSCVTIQNKSVIFTNRLITKTLLCFIYGLLEYKSSLCGAINGETYNLKIFEANIVKEEQFKSSFVLCKKDIKVNISCNMAKNIKNSQSSNIRNETYFKVMSQLVGYLIKQTEIENFSKNIDEFEKMLKNLAQFNTLSNFKYTKQNLTIDFDSLQTNILDDIGASFFNNQYKLSSFKNIEDSKTRSVIEFLINDTKIDCGRGYQTPYDNYTKNPKSSYYSSHIVSSSSSNNNNNNSKKSTKRVTFEDDEETKKNVKKQKSNHYGAMHRGLGQTYDDDDENTKTNFEIKKYDDIPLMLQDIKLKIAEYNSGRIDDFINDKTKPTKLINMVYNMMESMIESILEYYKKGIEGYVDIEVMDHQEFVHSLEDRHDAEREKLLMLNGDREEAVIDMLVNFNIQSILLEKTDELFLSISTLSHILTTCSKRNITYAQLENSFNFFSLNFVKNPIINIFIFLPEFLIIPYVDACQIYFNFSTNMSSVRSQFETKLQVLKSNSQKNVLYFTFCNIQIIPLDFFVLYLKANFKVDSILKKYKENYNTQLETMNTFLDMFVGLFIKNSKEFTKEIAKPNTISSIDLKQYSYDNKTPLDDYILGISNFGNSKIPSMLINSFFFLYEPSIYLALLNNDFNLDFIKSILDSLIQNFCSNCEFFLVRFMSVFYVMCKLEYPAILKPLYTATDMTFTISNTSNVDDYSKFTALIIESSKKIADKPDMVEYFKKHGMILTKIGVKINVNMQHFLQSGCSEKLSVGQEYFEKMQTGEFVHLEDYLTEQKFDNITECIDVQYTDEIKDDFQNLKLTDDRIILLYLLGGNVNPIVAIKQIGFDNSFLENTLCIKNLKFNTKTISINWL